MDWCKKLKELVQDPKLRGKLTLKLLKETEEFRRVIFYDDDAAVEASLLALIAEDTRSPTLVYQLHGNLRCFQVCFPQSACNSASILQQSKGRQKKKKKKKPSPQQQQQV